MGTNESQLLDDEHLRLIRLYTRACVHALNNCLSVASGYQQLLTLKLHGEEPPNPETVAGYVREMETSLAEAERILRNLSTWAKPAAPDLRGFRLDRVLKSILDRFGRSQPEVGSRLTRDIPDSLPPVNADEAMLAKALEAILDNAVRATAENKGTISVSLLRNPNAGSPVGAFEQSVRIRDQGCGIDPNRLPHLQLPVLAAFQDIRKPLEGWKGPGFGLPMAFSYARLMGGRLSVDSRPDVGTTVTLTLREAER